MLQRALVIITSQKSVKFDIQTVLKIKKLTGGWKYVNSWYKLV